MLFRRVVWRTEIVLWKISVCKSPRPGNVLTSANVLASDGPESRICFLPPWQINLELYHMSDKTDAVKRPPACVCMCVRFSIYSCASYRGSFCMLKSSPQAFLCRHTCRPGLCFTRLKATEQLFNVALCSELLDPVSLPGTVSTIRWLKVKTVELLRIQLVKLNENIFPQFLTFRWIRTKNFVFPFYLEGTK